MELTVVRVGLGWAGACSRCGVLPIVWVTETWAAYDVMGHAAAHHGC